jgi:hypothetical protein
MRKAGLDAEVARLLRLRDAHIDDQYNIRRTIKRTTADIENCRRQIVWLESDIARRIPTDDDEIIFSSDGTAIADRKAVGEKILRQAHEMRARGIPNRQMLGTFNGIDLEISGYEAIDDEGEQCICTAIAIQHHGEHRGFEVTDKTRSSTVVGRIESSIRNLDADLANLKANLEADERRLPAFEARLGQEFSDTALLEDKIRELADLEAELANTKGEFEPGNDNAPLTEREDTQGELLPPPAASVA